MPDNVDRSALIAYVNYPGCTGVEAASFTLSHGVSPSVCCIECREYRWAGSNSNELAFYFGALAAPRKVLSFKNCRVEQPQLHLGQNGPVVSLRVLDRRWKWEKKLITGHYNLKHPDGTLISKTERTLRQLFGRLFEELDEPNYSLPDLDPDARPEVVWETAPAAQALADLCEQIGVRVALCEEDRIKVFVSGQGASLPTKGTNEPAMGFTIPSPTDNVYVVCGASKFQNDFDLEAVGLDKDGHIRPINDLSYAPENGWERTSWPAFPELASDKQAQQLAIQTIYRWYRIKVDGVVFSKVDGKEKSISADDDFEVLPLDDRLLEVMTAPDGTTKPKPAEIRGVFHSSLKPGADGNSDEYTLYPRSWTLNQVTGVVEFAERVMKLADNLWKPAELKLRCSCSVRDPDIFAWSRYYEREAVAGGNANGKQELGLPHDEIVYKVTPKYDDTGKPTGKFDTNIDDVKKEARHYIDWMLKILAQARQTEEQLYDGIIPIKMDGAIQQITWQVQSGNIPTTRASRNTEHSVAVPSYQYRRLWEQVRDARIKLETQAAQRRRAQGQPT